MLDKCRRGIEKKRRIPLSNADLVEPILKQLAILVEEALDKKMIGIAATLAEAGCDIRWMAEAQDIKIATRLPASEKATKYEIVHVDTQERI